MKASIVVLCLGSAAWVCRLPRPGTRRAVPSPSLHRPFTVPSPPSLRRPFIILGDTGTISHLSHADFTATGDTRDTFVPGRFRHNWVPPGTIVPLGQIPCRISVAGPAIVGGPLTIPHRPFTVPSPPSLPYWATPGRFHLCPMPISPQLATPGTPCPMSISP
jgi:hypothetical protein